MKKLIAFVFVLVCIFAMAGCSNNTYKIKITVPAGSQEPFVYSDEIICPTGKRITVSCGEGLSDTEVLLKTVDETLTPGYVAKPLTTGMPVEFDTDKGMWLKVGISIQNDTDTDQIVYVEVTGIELKFE